MALEETMQDKNLELNFFRNTETEDEIISINVSGYNSLNFESPGKRSILKDE